MLAGEAVDIEALRLQYEREWEERRQAGVPRRHQIELLVKENEMRIGRARVTATAMIERGTIFFVCRS